MPIDRRLHIRCVLRYQQLHGCDGHFDFQLRRTACKDVLGHLCSAAYYPCAPSFATCSSLPQSSEDICQFLDDPVVDGNGQFLSLDAVEEKKRSEKKTVLKYPPPFDEAIDMPDDEGDANDEGEDDELICFVCLKGDVSDDNDIVICDGDHSEPRGCHQLCCQAPLHTIPGGPWFCPDCQQDEASAPPSRGTDADYVPSMTTASSTSSSNSSSSSSGSESSTSNSDSSSDSSEDTSSDSSDSSGSASD